MRVLRHAAEKARKLAAQKEKQAQTLAKPAVEEKAKIRTVSDETMQRERDESARRDHETKVRLLQQKSAVPKRYRGATLAGAKLDQLPAAVAQHYRAAIADLEAWVWRPSLIAMIGDRGPGKTWLGCGSVNDYITVGRSARYAKAMTYIIALKETYGKDSSRHESDVERDFLQPELLVLDEMHERRFSAWEDMMLTRLIDLRYDAELTTMLISNDDEAGFVERIGLSVADRMRDGGILIKCEWETLRGKVRAS